MIPKKALNTGQLLDWFEDNNIDLFHFELKYKTLDKNQKHIKQLLQLKHFIPCKDGKPLEKPLRSREMFFKYISKDKEKHRKELDDFEQAEKAVIFDGWEKCEHLADHITDGKNIIGIEICPSWSKGEICVLDVDTYTETKSIEQLITQIPDIKITPNYYSEIFN